MRDVKRLQNSKDLCHNMNCSLINFWQKRGMPKSILLVDFAFCAKRLHQNKRHAGLLANSIKDCLYLLNRPSLVKVLAKDY